MQPESKKELSMYRIEKAKECLVAAKTLLDAGCIESVPNRSYYAAFNAMRAVLALDGIDKKRHSGILSEFRRLYIKTGFFGKEVSDIISELYDCRTEGDYDDFFVISKEDASQNVKNAELLIDEIASYLNNLN